MVVVMGAKMAATCRYVALHRVARVNDDVNRKPRSSLLEKIERRGFYARRV